MKQDLPEFDAHDLSAGHKFFVGKLPTSLILNATQFDTLWQMHPQDFHEIKIHGRLVKTPRWQQAYGIDYHYTGRVNKARPLPPLLQPFLGWARENVDENLNGLLLNWYDGALGHYIGRHRDSTTNIIPGSPIVTVSFGEQRIFRIRPYANQDDRLKKYDFPTPHGSVFVMPYETNLAFTHEVPRQSIHPSRRISVTLRAFVEQRRFAPPEHLRSVVSR